MGKKSGPNPTDRAKSGVKRSLLTEAAGLPVGLAVDGANRHDCKMVRETLQSVPPSIEKKRLAAVAGGAEGAARAKEQVLCLDAAYIAQEVRALAEAFGYTTQILSRSEESQARQAGHQAYRWVVERTHSWLNRYRRLLVRWEKKAHNYLALLHFACALITWNKCLFG